ncbi:hypothetical protein ACHQM5_006082 [Ranunculus cassubicifolius]
MARKRQRPYYTENPSSSISKKPRFKPSIPSFKPETPQIEEETKSTRQITSMVLVNGLCQNCSVLNLKSCLEIYGDISRIRIDNGIGYVNFRSKEFAEAAIDASLDPDIGISVDDQKVVLSWPEESLPQWREGVRLSVKERLSSSKLLQPEIPLSKHGRGKKLVGSSNDTILPRNGRLDNSYKPRDIIAYDDLF